MSHTARIDFERTEVGEGTARGGLMARMGLGYHQPTGLGCEEPLKVSEEGE